MSESIALKPFFAISFSFENIGRRRLGHFSKTLSIASFQHGVLESSSTWMSPGHPESLDAGHPCRHDGDRHFSSSVDERKIMNHLVKSRAHAGPLLGPIRYLPYYSYFILGLFGCGSGAQTIACFFSHFA